MERCNSLFVRLIPLLVGIGLFTLSCAAEPMTEAIPPTPTPISGGNIFFEPSRVSAETKAIEIRLVNVSERVPATEFATIITEPNALQKITTTLLSAVSTVPSGELPSAQQGSYLVSLYLYSQDDVLPLSGTSGQWLLASITYFYNVGFIAVDKPDMQGGRKTEFYPVGPGLLDILESELRLRGLVLPR